MPTFYRNKLKIYDNGLQLAEGGDFQHKLSYEALKFIYPQNCPTKNETATFGKVLLQAGVLVLRVLQPLSVLSFAVIVNLHICLSWAERLRF